MATYDLGDVVRITGTWTDSGGTATDPGTVSFQYTDPNGTATTYTYPTDAEVVKSDTGIYYTDISADNEGVYIWRWISTGDGQAADSGQFWVARTVIRAGMSKLINRVRALASAGTAEYTIGDITYWTDEHIQDKLDSNAQFVIDAPLLWQPQSIGGGTVTYVVAEAQYRDFEEATSGTARWIVRDGPGAQIGTANYSADYRQGRLTFTSDQGGTAYYLTGYTYDVHSAAADVWLERLANFADWYDFRADNQTFNRSQAYTHAAQQEKKLRGMAGANIVTNALGELRVGQFVRVDI